MLKKELLLTKAKRNNHPINLKIVVGEYSDTDWKIYGYNKDLYSDTGSFGKLTAIPYWGTENNYLMGLCSNYYLDDPDMQTFYFEYSIMGLNSKPPYNKIKVKVNNTSSEFDFTEYEETDNYDKIFSSNNKNKEYSITFDPIPDGYLDPNTFQPIFS